MKRSVLIVLAIAAMLALGFTLLAPQREQAKGPLVLAASSLQESLEAAADAWAAKGHAKPVLSFAGTPALARQIEAGAPADIFISADEQWMDELARKGLIQHRLRGNLVSNELVLVEPSGRNTRLSLEPGAALSFALKPRKIAVADPESVPAGRYARQALTSLEVWNDVKSNIVAAENVRAAAILVAKGEAPLGIVYRTDALADPKLRIVATFPPSSHVPIDYPIALLKASTHDDAEDFRQFLLSEKGAAIFRRFGFAAGSTR